MWIGGEEGCGSEVRMGCGRNGDWRFGGGLGVRGVGIGGAEGVGGNVDGQSTRRFPLVSWKS